MSFKGALCASLEVYAVFCMRVHPLAWKRTQMLHQICKGYVIHTHKGHFVYKETSQSLWDPLSALQSAGKRTPQRRHHNGYRWDTILHKCEDALQPLPLSHVTSAACSLDFSFPFCVSGFCWTVYFSPQCAGKDVKALVDTGCQYNLISSACGQTGVSSHLY